MSVTDQREQFLEATCGNIPEGWCPVLWFKTTGGTKITRAFLSIEEGLQYIADHANAADAYIHLALARVEDRADFTEGRRIANDTARGLLALGGDLDAGKTGCPSTKADAVKLAEAMPIPPTLFVDTGRGVHPWWCFREPWTFDKDEERIEADALNRAWHMLLHATAAKLGWSIDSTPDLARVLRVPGTHNRKQPDRPLPVKIIRADGPRVNPDDLRDLPELEPYWEAAWAAAMPGEASGDVELVDESTAYGLSALRGICRDLAETPEGNRDNATNKAAYRCGQLIAGGQLARRDVENAIRDACERNGLTQERGGKRVVEEKLVRSINDGMKQPARPEPRATTATQDEDQGAAPTVSWRCTELGMAERFRDAHLDQVRWCAELDKWLVWRGSRWAIDDTGEVLRLAKRTVLRMYAEAGFIDEDKAREDFLKFIKSCERDRALRAILSLAQSELPLPVRLGDLDFDGWLLNCENGTLDLRTGELRAHRPADLCMKQIPVAFDATAKCPTWDAFLLRVMDGNQDMINFLQCAVGASLPAHQREQVLFILHGGGANGKSVFISTMLALLGSYATAAEPQTLLTQRNDDKIRNDVADLAGKRLVTTSEIGAGKRLDEALVKRLTGSDRMKARFLFHEHFEFDPLFRVWLATNHRPEIKETTHAIWRRVRLVPFDVTIPDAEQDPDLPAKLRDELPGILNWALAGCLAWQANGRLQTPETVRNATAAYRDEQDPLSAFIDDRCIISASAWTWAGDLRETYEAYCEREREKPMSPQAFGRALRERGMIPERKTAADGKTARAWLGIGIAEG